MLLYAGTTLNIYKNIFSFKYSILSRLVNFKLIIFIYNKCELLKDIVKKLKQWSQSAGNNLLIIKNINNNKYLYKYNNNIGTSETLRNKITFILFNKLIINEYNYFAHINNKINLIYWKIPKVSPQNEAVGPILGVSEENIKKVSIHVPTHLKPCNDIQFGYYLAGLIDGNGHFNNQQQLIIVFNLLDISLAYYIKSYLKYGNVIKIKDKNTVILIIVTKKGIEKVINLINGKIRSENIYNQIINNNILNNNNINFHLNKNNDLNNNHWLVGFADVNGSFQIKIIDRSHPIYHLKTEQASDLYFPGLINPPYACNAQGEKRLEVRLNFQIDQNKNDMLILIKDYLGGSIYFNKNKNIYYYNSTNFSSAKKVINYFDKFHLLSSKQINYLKWRKIYLIIQNKDHLNINGINKIMKFYK